MEESQTKRRIRILARVAFIWAFAIAARLVYLQIWQHKDFVRVAEQQQQLQEEIRGPRGTIFDRNGLPLAKSLPVDSVCINPLRVPDVATAAEMLAGTLKLDPVDLYSEIQNAAEKKRGFLWIKRRITPDESRRLRSMNLDWIEFRTESRRFYPNGTLAAHVIGGVDAVERGNAGLELAYDEELRGRSGKVKTYVDSHRNAWAQESRDMPLPGKDVYTTIDSRIQYVAERALAEAVGKSGAKTGSVVVIDPHTNDVLALVNYPTYDPNDVSFDPSDGHRNNLAITSPYEPGSVFKVVTLSAALETTRMTPDTVVFCGNGILRLGSRTIHEAHGGYGSLSMADVLAKSSNIGAIQIGLRVGQENMIEYVKRLGFGVKTGVGFKGENGGKVRKKWGSTSLASVSMGHEVMVTAMQLAQFGVVIANGGMLARPRIVTKLGRPGEEITAIPQAQAVRALQGPTVIKMRQMMEGVVLHGTGKGKANLKGYTSGGKTGTAQIYDFKSHQYTHFYNGSFLGFAPVTNPAIAMIVTLNHTQGTIGYGGQAAAPVFREVATAALRILDVPKDLPEDAPPVKEDKSLREEDTAIAALDNDAEAELAEVEAPAIQGLSAEDQQLLAVARKVTGPKVPNFVGKTMRDVLEDAASRGLPVEVMGSGIARLQMPPPGAVLPQGAKIRVQFIR